MECRPFIWWVSALIERSGLVNFVDGGVIFEARLVTCTTKESPPGSGRIKFIYVGAFLYQWSLWDPRFVVTSSAC